MLHARVGDGATERQFFENMKGLQMHHAGVGDFRAPQLKFLEPRETFEVRQAGIRNRIAVEDERFQPVQAIEVCQARVGHIGARADEHQLVDVGQTV